MTPSDLKELEQWQRELEAGAISCRKNARSGGVYSTDDSRAADRCAALLRRVLRRLAQVDAEQAQLRECEAGAAAMQADLERQNSALRGASGFLARDKQNELLAEVERLSAEVKRLDNGWNEANTLALMTGLELAKLREFLSITECRLRKALTESKAAHDAALASCQKEYTGRIRAQAEVDQLRMELHHSAMVVRDWATRCAAAEEERDALRRKVAAAEAELERAKADRNKTGVDERGKWIPVVLKLQQKVAAAEGIMNRLKGCQVGRLREEVDAALIAWREADK